jgi:hypothetical protein
VTRVVAGLLSGLLVLGGAACARPSDAGMQPLEVVDELRVGLTEWSIETGPVEAVAGDVAVVVTNTGGTEHDLIVHGRHGTWRTPMLAPGERFELLVRTAPGEQLHLECTVTGHHAQGMHAEVPVAGLGR